MSSPAVGQVADAETPSSLQKPLDSAGTGRILSGACERRSRPRSERVPDVSIKGEVCCGQPSDEVLSCGVQELLDSVSLLDEHRKEQEGLRRLVGDRRVSAVRRAVKKQRERSDKGVSLAGEASTTTESAVENVHRHLADMHSQRRAVAKMRSMFVEAVQD